MACAQTVKTDDHKGRVKDGKLGYHDFGWPAGWLQCFGLFVVIHVIVMISLLENDDDDQIKNKTKQFAKNFS